LDRFDEPEDVLVTRTTPRAPFVVTTMLDEEPFHPTTQASFTVGLGASSQNRFPSFTAVPQGGAAGSQPLRFPAFPAVVNAEDNEVDNEIATSKVSVHWHCPCHANQFQLGMPGELLQNLNF